jgi:hypothetical protein
VAREGVFRGAFWLALRKISCATGIPVAQEILRIAGPKAWR